MGPKAILFALLAVFTVAFIAFWAVAAHAARGDGAEGGGPRPSHLAIGFITDFLDTLGVGSFATTTALYKLGRVVDDAHLPGTLNVGHAVPTFVQALLFIATVQVEMTTLVSMIAAAVLGAWLGAGVVSSWPRRRIQIGMGVLLLGAATIIFLRVTKLVPGGGEALGLHGSRLIIGVVGNFVLGALMMLGIGLYAPCMILVYLLGMTPSAAFPIMMGSCAFLMPAASVRFVREGRYDRRAALGLAIAGTPAVLIAYYIVKSLPLSALQWLVVAVVVYTAIAMLRSALREEKHAA